MLPAKLAGLISGLDHGNGGVHVSTLAGDWSGGILVAMDIKRSAVRRVGVRRSKHSYIVSIAEKGEDVNGR